MYSGGVCLQVTMVVQFPGELQLKISLFFKLLNLAVVAGTLRSCSVWINHFWLVRRLVGFFVTYEKCTFRVIHNRVLSELFEMLTGVRQGCLLSPFLFLLFTDWIMRRTTKKHQDVILWTLTTRLEDLDFADNISLLSHNHRGMQSKLTRLAKISIQMGLSISKSRTKVMRVNTRNTDKIESDGDEIDQVEDFAYLGSNISKDSGSDQDL